MEKLNFKSNIARQSVICSSNINNVFVAYAFDHSERTFRKVIIAGNLNAALRKAALLIDRYTVEYGSIAKRIEDAKNDYLRGFISGEDLEDEVAGLLNPVSFEYWDLAFRMWSNFGAGISIGVAPWEEFLPNLSDENLAELKQLIVEELQKA